jgi:hypothetical protein
MCLECKYGLEENIFKDYIMVGPKVNFHHYVDKMYYFSLW